MICFENRDELPVEILFEDDLVVEHDELMLIYEIYLNHFSVEEIDDELEENKQHLNEKI
ncbi:hypothetical protein HOG21_07400 [bacterium]|nr:hypothetical protein [bacterium]